VSRARLLLLVRYGLPAVICITGLVFIAIDLHANLEGGMALIGAGLSVLLINVLFRIGVSGDRERTAEAAARREFDRTGRWPEE
jgi:hypothetical protein